jgi:hypothetical protein
LFWKLNFVLFFADWKSYANPQSSKAWFTHSYYAQPFFFDSSRTVTLERCWWTHYIFWPWTCKPIICSSCYEAIAWFQICWCWGMSSNSTTHYHVHADLLIDKCVFRGM